MASFGHVLNLLDDRYLNLHDVVGNVEPMPTLVPYREYAHSVLVLRMDTSHELFMGLIHEFTARIAHETRTELWTWLVQWEVNSNEAGQLSASVPSPKKPRLEADIHKTELNEQHTQPRAPIIDIFERCVINAELMKEEDLLRILIDIVQVDSSIVPNFIEFLYRWIDYYEGDGTALKAALKWEIPSLWDFEYHPLVLPADIKKQMHKDEAKKPKEPTGAPVKSSREQDLAQGSPTKKMRQKPDLEAMERQTQESERLQYREVRYGIQPPKLKLPMSPLINIPRDQAQRLKYYAACYKSRHRALVHLMEAGISMQQISNYQKLQEEHPKDTPETLENVDPKDLKGLRHYYKDADAAQGIHLLREKLQLRREKQKEIAISSRLAVEAQLATSTGTTGGASGIPLIPPTPSYTRTPDMAADMLRRIQSAKFIGPERINFVPTPVVGKMKSDLFEGAKDSQLLPPGIQPGLTLPREAPVLMPYPGEDMVLDNGDEDGNSDEGSDEGSYEGNNSDGNSSDSDDGSNDDNDDLSDPVNQASALSAITQHTGTPTLAGGLAAGLQHHYPPHMAGIAIPSPLHGRSTANVNALFQHLAPEQAHSLLPLVNPRSRQEVAANIAMRMSSIETTMPGNAAERASSQAPARMQTATTASSSLMTGNTNTVMTAGASRSRSASLPYLPPPPIRPPPVAVPPRGNGPTLSFLPTPNRSPAHAMVPSSGPSLPLSGQRPANFQSHGQPPSSSSHQPSQLNLNPRQVPPRTLLGLLTPPQVLRPQHDIPRASATQPLPASHFPPVPSAPGMVAPILTGGLQQVVTRASTVPGPQNGGLEYHTTTSYMQQPPYAGLMLPPSTTGHPQNAQALRPNTPQSLQRAPVLAPRSSYAEPEHQNRPTPPPSGSILSPPRLGIQRNAPAPLDLPPALRSPSPFSSLGHSLLATTPFLPTPQGIPIQIYFPKIVIPGNGIGPGGRRLGTDSITETDALLVGHTHPGTGKIILSKALFLPLGVWKNTMNRVHKNAYSVLETYAAPPGHPGLTGKLGAVGTGPCHAAVYKKLEHAYNMMRCSSAKQRELDLTKRWRATKGPMTRQDRGAVWEGYGVTLDGGIEMSAEERVGALMYSWLVDEGVEKKPDSRKSAEEIELEKRYAELEELEREEEEMGIDWDEEFAMMDKIDVEMEG